MDGNSDHDTINVQALNVAPIAKCVQIKPTSSQGNIALRVELYGQQKGRTFGKTPTLGILQFMLLFFARVIKTNLEKQILPSFA